MLNRKKLKELLENHDWYYQYSGDFSVWKNGSDEVDAIHKIIRESGDKFGEAIALHNSTCPEGHEIDSEGYHC